MQATFGPYSGHIRATIGPFGPIHWLKKPSAFPCLQCCPWSPSTVAQSSCPKIFLPALPSPPAFPCLQCLPWPPLRRVRIFLPQKSSCPPHFPSGSQLSASRSRHSSHATRHPSALRPPALNSHPSTLNRFPPATARHPCATRKSLPPCPASVASGPIARARTPRMLCKIERKRDRGRETKRNQHAHSRRHGHQRSLRRPAFKRRRIV
jgi:hypothetical protein